MPAPPNLGSNLLTLTQIVASLIHEIGLQPNKGHISSWAVAHHLSVGEPAVYSEWGQ